MKKHHLASPKPSMVSFFLLHVRTFNVPGMFLVIHSWLESKWMNFHVGVGKFLWMFYMLEIVLVSKYLVETCIHIILGLKNLGGVWGFSLLEVWDSWFLCVVFINWELCIMWLVNCWVAKNIVELYVSGVVTLWVLCSLVDMNLLCLIQISYNSPRCVNELRVLK